MLDSNIIINDVLSLRHTDVEFLSYDIYLYIISKGKIWLTIIRLEYVCGRAAYTISSVCNSQHFSREFYHSLKLHRTFVNKYLGACCQCFVI